jgi:type II secretory pathway component PulM
MKAGWQHWWTSRERREREVLLLGAWALAALLVLAFAVLPVYTQHRLLATRLPELRAHIAELEAQADQAEALRARLTGLPASDPTALGPAAAASVEAAARGAGLGAQLDTFKAQGNGRVQLGGAKVGFDAFMDWTTRLRASAGLTLESLQSDALDEPGMVRLTAVLGPVSGTPGAHP